MHSITQHTYTQRHIRLSETTPHSFTYTTNAFELRVTWPVWFRMTQTNWFSRVLLSQHHGQIYWSSTKTHRSPIMLPRRFLYDCLRVRTSACHLPFDRCAGCPWCLKNCRPQAWFASTSMFATLVGASCYAIRDSLRIQQVRRSSEFCCMTISIICIRAYILHLHLRSCAIGRWTEDPGIVAWLIWSWKTKHWLGPWDLTTWWSTHS